MYCRVKPSVDSDIMSTIKLDGDEGSLRLVDPSKTKDPEKIFQFNKVFGGTATQGELVNSDALAFESSTYLDESRRGSVQGYSAFDPVSDGWV